MTSLHDLSALLDEIKGAARALLATTPEERREPSIWNPRVDRLKDAISKAEGTTPMIPTSAGLEAGAVEVRPLDWVFGEGNYEGQQVWHAGDPWLFWIVKNTNRDEYVWCETLNVDGFVPASPVRGKFDTLEAAQTAAQADFESRIRSALIPPSRAGEAVAQLGAGSPRDLHNVLKAVLHHFGPEGAQKVTEDALAMRLKKDA